VSYPGNELVRPYVVAAQRYQAASFTLPPTRRGSACVTAGPKDEGRGVPVRAPHFHHRYVRGDGLLMTTGAVGHVRRRSSCILQAAREFESRQLADGLRPGQCCKPGLPRRQMISPREMSAVIDAALTDLPRPGHFANPGYSQRSTLSLSRASNLDLV
jgi:hypothetical protein